VLRKLEDSAVLEKLAFTTDSYVIKPIFFPGGNIGKLAVTGTINDLLASGAVPKYLSLSLIIEEGFEFEKLEKVLESARTEANLASVEIVTGDTKVVGHGELDEIFVNTAGIGIIEGESFSISKIKPGDKIIVTGTIGEHGLCVLATRKGLELDTNLVSDCAALTGVGKIARESNCVHYMRDPTRGGLGGILAEIAIESNFGIEIYEEKIPIKEEVRGIAEILGIDPLYSANEGKFVIFVENNKAETLLEKIKTDRYGKDAEIIGEVVHDHPGKCLLITRIGGKRLVDLPPGELLPRIC